MEARRIDYIPRSMLWDEDQLRTLLREIVRKTRESPMRPDGTYNYSMEALVQRALDEYHTSEGWRSRLFDAVIDDASSVQSPYSDE